MMHRGSFFFVLVLFTGILYSQNTYLRSVTHLIPPYIDFWKYTEQNIPDYIISTTSDSSTVIMFYNFTRDKNQKLLSTEIRDLDKTVLYSFNYYYNTSNQVERIEKWSDMDYDHVVDDLDHVFFFYYDTLGRVNRLAIKKGTYFSRDLHFTWSGDDIVQVNNEDGELNYILRLEYDNVPNIIESIKCEYLPTTGNLEFYVTMFSKHNITKATLYPTAMDSTVLGIKPEYDENGFYISNGVEKVIYEYSERE